MKRMPFEPPTEHYDKRIETVDEQICNLIQKRMELSDGQPGFPEKQLIASWAEKYDFYEDFLNSLFISLLNEEMYKPVVEPKGFVKNIPLLKTFEENDAFYTITFIRQFDNASVIHLHIDRNEPMEMEEMLHYRHQSFFALSIESDGVTYDCRYIGGSGSGGHISQEYIISPALPEDCDEYILVFKELEEPFRKPTGFEFRM